MTFLLESFADAYASIGFGQRMSGGDIVVVQFLDEKAILSDRYGIGHVDLPFDTT